MPLLDLETLRNEAKIHYYEDQKIADTKQTFKRLVRKVQDFYSVFYVHFTRDMVSLYDAAFTVDYGIDNCSGKPVIDLSFTYLDWKIAETL